MIIETDAAWAAGFLDGEGCFSIRVAGDSFHPIVEASQVDPRPLLKLQQMALKAKIIDLNRRGVAS